MHTRALIGFAWVWLGGAGGQQQAIAGTRVHNYGNFTCTLRERERERDRERERERERESEREKTKQERLIKQKEESPARSLALWQGRCRSV